MINNNNGMAVCVKPERWYSQVNLGFDEIKEGDIIPAIVTGYNWEKGQIECMISSIVRNGVIRTEDFSFPTITFGVNEYHIPGEISSHINKLIIAKVVKKHDDGMVEMDRKSVMKDTCECLVSNIGNTVTATIESIYRYGAFVDLGNGIQSLLHISEFSKCRYSNLKDLFSIGEAVKVKLLEFDAGTNWFMVSRKEAYERKILEHNSIQRVKVFGVVDGGVFVEYDPATVGIMDIPVYAESHLREGDYAIARIKRNVEKGFKANFISKSVEMR